MGNRRIVESGGRAFPSSEPNSVPLFFCTYLPCILVRRRPFRCVCQIFGEQRAPDFWRRLACFGRRILPRGSLFLERNLQAHADSPPFSGFFRRLVMRPGTCDRDNEWTTAVFN